MVLADLPGDDILLCQITSQQAKDSFSILFDKAGFHNGSLPVDSYIRTSRIFTADKKITIRIAGRVNKDVQALVIHKIISIIQ